METKQDIQDSDLVAPIVGHVGDGNFHLVLLCDPDDSEEMKRANALNERMISRAQAMGGTCTGEHGVGYGKIPYLQNELGPAVPFMAAVKKSLDPLNILNPGKIIKL